MLTINYGERYSPPCTLILGGFDGIHRGHETLVARAKERGLPVGLMLLGGKGETVLFTKEERLSIAEELGIDFCLIVNLDEVKDIPAETFLDGILSDFSVECFVSGEDFRFGAGAKGTPLLLSSKRETICCPLITENGEKISSSAVRLLIERGEIERANSLLYLPFFVMGKVEHGREVGRTYGFPTANIVYPKRKVPLGYGVYAVRVGRFRGIANYGARPTFGDERPLLEVYLDGFSGDLYGQTVKVVFERKIRDIKKFKSKEELKEQLERDVLTVR